MLKKIFRLVKKIVVAGLAIYAYNVLATPINATIPINFISPSPKDSFLNIAFPSNLIKYININITEAEIICLNTTSGVSNINNVITIARPDIISTLSEI